MGPVEGRTVAAGRLFGGRLAFQNLAMKSLSCLLFVATAACGSKSTATSTAPTSESAQVVLPDVPFDDLDHDQKIEFMKQKVVPAMEPIFKNHDPQEFAEFGCQTCHGAQAAKGHFDMPSTDLPKLDFKDTSKFKKEDLEWMAQQVKPAMAKLLSRPEYTPETPTGFGCQNCHMVE
jgi:mono/diheme cytochrome c family protein